MLTLSLGLGLLFLHFYTAYASQATNVLFGNVLGISLRTVIVLAVLAVVILVALVLIARPLLFASLQPELAEAQRRAAQPVSTLFMVIVAVATAEAIQIVGVLLVFALMVGAGGHRYSADARRARRHRGLDGAGRHDRLGQPVARLPDRLADELLDHGAGCRSLSGQRHRATLDGPGRPGRQ